LPAGKDAAKPAIEDAGILFPTGQLLRAGQLFHAGDQSRGGRQFRPASHQLPAGHRLLAGRQVRSNQPPDSWKEWKNLRHYLFVNLGSTWVHELVLLQRSSDSFYPQNFDRKYPSFGPGLQSP
jgi:hypothetical protein